MDSFSRCFIADAAGAVSLEELQMSFLLMEGSQAKVIRAFRMMDAGEEFGGSEVVGQVDMRLRLAEMRCEPSRRDNGSSFCFCFATMCRSKSNLGYQVGMQYSAVHD